MKIATGIIGENQKPTAHRINTHTHTTCIHSMSYSSITYIVSSKMQEKY